MWILGLKGLNGRCQLKENLKVETAVSLLNPKMANRLFCLIVYSCFQYFDWNIL